MNPSVASRPLSPLLQRLHLYFFAYAQIDPTCPLQEKWKLGNPQWVGSESRRARWRGVLGPLKPMNPMGPCPVCSDSAQALRKVRQKQPSRPLILCQTPFEPLLPKSKLRGLAHHPNWITPVLWTADPTDVLLWGQELQNLNTKYTAPFLKSEVHPLRRLWQRLKRHHDPRVFSHRFGLREDGRIEDQLPLFEATSTCDISTIEKTLVTHDAAFLAAVKNAKRRSYIFSRSATSLAWFARDVTRLLGPSFHTTIFPQLPDSRDPQSFFVLVKDASIAFSRLLPDCGSLHLDWQPQSLAFRRYRMMPNGTATWRGLRTPVAMDRLEYGGFHWSFHKTANGWQSWLGEDKNVSQENRGLSARIHFWHTLRHS